MTDYDRYFDGAAALKLCPRCGFELPLPGNDYLPPAALYHPWHIRDRAALLEYVSSLSEETHEWLLALYVDDALNLLGVDTVGRGGVGDCRVDFGLIYCRARSVGAAGFFLAHNHPSGDPTPSRADIQVTNRLRRLSAEMDLSLIEHVVIAESGVQSIC